MKKKSEKSSSMEDDESYDSSKKVLSENGDQFNPQVLFDILNK